MMATSMVHDTVVVVMTMLVMVLKAMQGVVMLVTMTCIGCLPLLSRHFECPGA